MPRGVCCYCERLVLFCLVIIAIHHGAVVMSLAQSDSLTNFWRIQQGHRSSPSGRIGAVSFNIQNGIVVYGGFSFNSFAFGLDRMVPERDVWQYSINADNWNDISRSFPPLSARGFHAITDLNALVGGAYIFGGYSRPYPELEASSLNPLIAVDTLSFVSSFSSRMTILDIERKDGASWPQARGLHTLDLVSRPSSVKRCAVLFGGKNENGILGDTWILNSDTNTWVQVGESNDGKSPSPRYGHTAFTVNKELVLLGGCDGNFTSCQRSFATTFRDMWAFTITGQDCSTGEWREVGDVVFFPSTFLWGGKPYYYNSATNQLIVFESRLDSSNSNALITIKPVLNGTGSVTGVEWGFEAQSRLSQLPPHRQGGTAIQIHQSTYDQVFYFGGGSEVGFLSDLWVYTSEARFWSESAADFVLPLSLAHAAHTTLNDKMYVSGGETWRGQFNRFLWAFHVKTGDWEVINSGITSFLTGATLTAINDNWLLQLCGFQGRFGSSTTDLGGYYNLRDEGSNAPFVMEIPRRAYHTAVYVPESKNIFLYGGWLRLMGLSFQEAQYIGDMTIGTIEFDNDQPRSPVWRIVQTSGESPGLLAGHVAVKLKTSRGNTMFVYGGCTPSGSLSNSVYKLDLDVPILDLEWKKVSVSSQSRPFAFLSSYVIFNSTILTVGGLVPGVNGTWTSVNDLHLGFITNEGFEWRNVFTISRIRPIFGAMLTLNTIDPPHITSIGGFSMENSVLTESSGQRIIQVGCNPGEFSPRLVSTACSLCPIGTYASSPGQQRCTQCPGISTTMQKGAYQVEQCNACGKGACVNGDCLFEIGTANHRCICDSGWGGTKCDTNVVGITIGTLFAIFICGAVGFFVFRRVRTRFHHMRIYQDLQEQLIQESQQELTELKKAWEIDADDLKFERSIDAGAFGEVWLASWQDRMVAVKKLKQSVNLFDERAVEDFNAEVSLIRSLRHRNIVFFFGAGVLDECPFLVTEFMSRGSLSSILASDIELSKTRCIEFALDTASGMTFLHELDPPRIHRDIKSANMLVSDQWVVKVADFGTARLCNHVLPGVASNSSSHDSPGSNYSSTNMTTAVGTLVWSAPEVLDGKPYGPFADVFSFGVVLYEICTRCVPYDDVDIPTWELRTAIINGLRPTHGLQKKGVDISDLLPLARDEGFVALLRQCLRRAPEERPSMRESRDMLDVILGKSRMHH
eukprot:m.12026 g.12026  ORF g.12026 m.12026 type:complete len:1198 (+) comp3941_c0_seq1:220-3813(+)